MEELTNFGMKSNLTLLSLANKFLNILRDDNDEPIYTYTDPFMQNFVKQSMKGGGCNAFNQGNKSELSDDVFHIISKKKLNINSNICDLLKRYSEFLNKYEKPNAKDFDSKYETSRAINQKGKAKHINNKLNMLPILELFNNW